LSPRRGSWEWPGFGKPIGCGMLDKDGSIMIKMNHVNAADYEYNIV
jgi:hypothetical protein